MANGLVALIPKYGIEGMIKWSEEELKESDVTYDAENSTFMHGGSAYLQLFQKISIALNVEEIESSQRQKLVISLITPSLPSPKKRPLHKTE
jgi:hypothetical protein